MQRGETWLKDPTTATAQIQLTLWSWSVRRRKLTEPVAPSARLNSPMPTDRGRGWLVTGVLTLIAVMVRFWQLGYRTDGGTPIFDEKYYSLHSWQVLFNGGYEDNFAYPVVVHPPLGKQIIAIGEWLFGYNGFGWRFGPVVAHSHRIGDPSRCTARSTAAQMANPTRRHLVRPCPRRLLHRFGHSTSRSRHWL